MSEQLIWFTSSYSNSEGGNCVEVALAWRKSSYSDSEGGNCVEVASCPHTVHFRDSKLTAGPEAAVSADAWRVFVAYAIGERSA